MVYTECFGIQKVKDAGGNHVGYVAACGSGIEDNCGGIDTHLQAQCLADVRNEFEFKLFHLIFSVFAERSKLCQIELESSND